MLSPSPSGGAPSSNGAKVPLMRRQSSQSSHNSNSKHGAPSPSSGGEHQPLRHHVKARQTRILLPRQHSSGRNLAKMGRHASATHVAPGAHGADMVRKPSREKSHDSDVGIRLPGSLDEHANRTPLRRNWTSTQLPRNTSHAKLKKNLSHGQLTRLGSGRNLAALNTMAVKGPPSPGVKGVKRRWRSADTGEIEKDLHEQEVELHEQQEEQKKDGPKKVGFAVGSSGDGDSEAEDEPKMEGSGLQEDEWTDQSTSASPYSTRQNTANNSRRTSMVFDKQAEHRQQENRHPEIRVAVQQTNGNQEQRVHYAQSPSHANKHVTEDGTSEESDVSDDDDEDEDEEPPSPRSMPQLRKHHDEQTTQSIRPPTESKTAQRSPLHGAKEHPNPATRHLLSRSNQSSPAPALVSNVSAMDDSHGNRGSPAASMQSSRSNIGDGAAESEQHEEELISRFVPSASHPSSSSVGTGTLNTLEMGSFNPPEDESTLAAQNRDKSKTSLTSAPISPVSTKSGSSGFATPGRQRTRNEMKMMNEKIIADLEDAATGKPIVPPHVYDRRNESLKSYLQLAALNADGRGSLGGHTLSMGPEIFQGRFKAVNTELKVVQRFRDPIGESVERLQKCSDSRFAQIRRQRAPTGNRVPTSRSAVSLPQQGSALSTSASPPKTGAGPAKSAITSAKSTTQLGRGESRRGKVTFAQEPPVTHQVAHEDAEGDLGADAIARQLWESIGN